MTTPSSHDDDDDIGLAEVARRLSHSACWLRDILAGELSAACRGDQEPTSAATKSEPKSRLQ